MVVIAEGDVEGDVSPLEPSVEEKQFSPGKTTGKKKQVHTMMFTRKKKEPPTDHLNITT